MVEGHVQPEPHPHPSPRRRPPHPSPRRRPPYLVTPAQAGPSFCSHEDTKMLRLPLKVRSSWACRRMAN